MLSASPFVVRGAGLLALCAAMLAVAGPAIEGGARAQGAGEATQVPAGTPPASTAGGAGTAKAAQPSPPEVPLSRFGGSTAFPLVSAYQAPKSQPEANR